METSWERKRGVLIQGLRAIAGALRPAVGIAEAAVVRAETASSAEPSGPRSGSSVRRRIYVNQDGQPLFEVERIYRCWRAPLRS